MRDLLSHKGDDEGQIGLLVLGFTTIALMLVLVIAAASAVHLQHKRLAHLADGAAAHAADAVDSGAYYRATLPRGDLWTAGEAVPISDATVIDAVGAYLGRSDGVRGCANLRVARPTEAIGQVQAQVTLTCTARPPFFNVLPRSVWRGIQLTVTSTADAPTRNP